MLTDPDDAVGSCLECGALGGPVALPEPIAVARRRARGLTAREQAVFRLLGSGYDNRAIARELSISERTVKRYITAILAKLGLRSRLQAGLCALLLSWVPADVGWPEGLMDSSPAAGEDVHAPPPPGTIKERTMTFDALAALRKAGNPVDLLTAEQRDVLAQLTEDEVAVLNSVKRRLDAVSDAEVEGHSGIKIA
jgi:DNA-binding CsgD family transcriptional regulator